MHKNTKLPPCIRKAIYFLWCHGGKISVLAKEFHVTRSIVYRILKRGRQSDFSLHKSTNDRFCTLEYGLKKLSRAEYRAKQKLAKRVQRYEKKYPGEMVHFDTRSLRRAKQDDRSQKSTCLYVAIDDRSRYLFAQITRGKNQYLSADFLEKIVKKIPYRIETTFSDNGTEFKGNDEHEFKLVCDKYGIEQKFTRIGRPQTNGKAERVIRTIMENCLLDDQKQTIEDRKKILRAFVLRYNRKRPHSALKEEGKLLTPCQVLQKYSF